MANLFSIFKKEKNKIVHPEDGIWIIENFITQSQCNEIIDKIEKTNFKVARQYKEGRHNKETFLDEPYLVGLLKNRFKEITLSRKSINFVVNDFSLPLEFYKYEIGDFIKRHSDAHREFDGRFSKLTLVLYLSDYCKGGETYFEKYNVKINPRCGAALLFEQELHHEALVVTEGIKYVLRTNCYID